MIEISLIIPVYNVSKYILSCLDSVRDNLIDKQKIEIVIVNDGSTDNSLELITDFLEVNHLTKQHGYNIQIIDQQNQGLSVARNIGISIAKGKYLAFLDSDDIIINNSFFSDILAVINEYQPDIIQFSALRVDDAKNTSKFLKPLPYNGFYELNDEIWQYLCNQSAWFVWLRVVKISLFKEIEFPPNKKYEDALTIPYVCLKATNIYFLPKEYIGYRVNPNSITQKGGSQTIEDIGDAARKLLPYIKDKKQLNAAFASLAHIYIDLTYRTEGFTTAKSRWQRLKSEAVKYNFDKKFVQNKGNRLFIELGVYFFVLLKLRQTIKN